MASKNYHQTSYENDGNVKIKTSYTGPENVVNAPVFLKMPNRQLNCKSNILDITSVQYIVSYHIGNYQYMPMQKRQI